MKRIEYDRRIHSPMKLLIPVLSLLLATTTVMANASFKVSKKVVNEPGQFLQSAPRITLPKGMIVQGSEVRYTVTASSGGPFKTEDFTYTFDFSQKQGDVTFGGPQGANKNFFKADWFGENIVTITAKNKETGEETVLEDRAICHFASRQVLGGNGNDLPEDYRKNIRRGDIHDISAEEKGMAYLPADFSRGDKSSEQIRKGFFETTEPRIFQTEKGTLIATVQARRIGPNDAPPGQGIVVQRSTDHGATWTDGMLLDQDDDDCWGYTALVEVDSTIYCYVSAGHPSHQANNLTVRGIFYFTSEDEGKTWSERIRHDQLSDALGFTKDKIPDGPSPNCNILVVPGLTLNGKKAPRGQGLLLSTYAHGYIWASINGGKKWSMVAHHKYYANAKDNDYGDPVQIENELAWCALDNKEGDIYMIWRRQASSGYKNEYLVSRDFKKGEDGMEVKGLYNQDLENVEARRCHFGLRRIPTGENKNKLLLATQGSGSRSTIRLGVSKKTITGNRISSNLFDEVTVMKDIGWGYCDIEYISAKAPGNKDMGVDGILMIGESEPIHTQTYQFIPLKPAGKGRNERYTASAFMLSMEYFEFLNK